MAAGTLTINGTPHNLPQPMQNGYSVDDGARGAAHRMASGAWVWEVTATGLFRAFTIEWTGLTAAQRNTVDGAVGALLQYGAGSWECYTGSTYTVVLGDGGLPRWRVRKVKQNSEYSFAGSLTLEQNA